MRSRRCSEKIVSLHEIKQFVYHNRTYERFYFGHKDKQNSPEPH
jgi:hypothetical protein